MNARELIVEAITPESVIDKSWIAVAKDRLQQLQSGAVKAVAAEEVFKKIAAKHFVNAQQIRTAYPTN